MTTSEIAREQWGTFFDDFSRLRRGWLVTVEVLGSSIGAQLEVQDLPLEGMTADFEQGASQIEITAGRGQPGHVLHTVTDPEHVWLKRDGDEDVLELEARGTITLVRVRATHY